MPIVIIKTSPTTWSLGQVCGGRAQRDLRFSPHMTYREASYLLRVEARQEWLV